MIIMYDETAKDSTLTANSSLINYPVSNILDSGLDRLFRTSSNTTAEIVFDAGAAITVDSICIANHNISASVTTLKIQGNATDVWTSPTINETLTYSSGIITKQFTGGSYRYWRLQVVDATNSDGYIQIGRVWLGDAYTTAGISPTLTDDKISTSVKSTGITGKSYMDLRYKYHSINTTFPKLTQAEKAIIFGMMDIVDYGIPFFVTFDDSNISLNTLYVTMGSDTLRATLLQDPRYWTIGFTLTEEV